MANHRKITINADLNIAHWNANGIRNKKGEVMDFISRNKIDILLLNERRLNEKQKCNIPGFKNFRKDRPANIAAGGVAIYCNAKIQCTEIEFNTVSCEAHGIKLSNNLTIISIYIRPQNKIATKDLQLLMESANKVLLIGDFNAKHQTWNCSNANQNGKIIHKYISNKPYAIQAPDNHTLFPYNDARPSTVDFAIIKNICNFKSIEALNDLDSDHHPIIITLSKNKTTTNHRTFLQYKEANWEMYREHINSQLKINSKLNNVETIEESVKTLTKAINDAAKISIPISKQNIGPIKLPNNIRHEITNRNKIRKLFQSTRRKSYKTLLNYL